MGWDAMVFGALEVPPAKVEGWLTSPVGTADFKSWPDFFNGELDAKPPEVLLEELKAVVVEPHEFIDLALEGGSLTLQGMMAKDRLLDVRMQLAVLFRSAAKHAGKGELIVMGYQTAAFGYRFKLEKGKSTAKLLTAKEQALVEKSKPYRQIDARTQGALDALLGNLGKSAGGGAKKGINPFTGKRG